jgi:hypothetical protein
MKVLETKYRGYRFRSRLEARWAVFMDALHVPYAYEPEAYDLDGLFYLLDFWLPRLKAFLEIKPAEPTAEEQEKALKLSKFTGNPVYIFFTPPQLLSYDDESAYLLEWVETDQGGFPAWDVSHWWCSCPNCGRVGIEFTGRSERLDCSCPNVKELHDFPNYDSERLIVAYEKARDYRFGPGAHNHL